MLPVTELSEISLQVLHMVHCELQLDVHNRALCLKLADLIHHVASAGYPLSSYLSSSFSTIIYLSQLLTMLLKLSSQIKFNIIIAETEQYHVSIKQRELKEA